MTPFEIFAKIHSFAMGYKVIQYKWKGRQIAIPEFLTLVPWNCDYKHFIEKWMAFCYAESEFYKVYDFYNFLDPENRKIFINWILENDSITFNS